MYVHAHVGVVVHVVQWVCLHVCMPRSNIPVPTIKWCGRVMHWGDADLKMSLESVKLKCYDLG